MQSYFFNIKLSYEACQRLYIPGINAIVVTDDNGKRIQLPTKNLRPFVSPLGINGRFRLQVSQQNKILNLDKIT